MEREEGKEPPSAIAVYSEREGGRVRERALGCNARGAANQPRSLIRHGSSVLSVYPARREKDMMMMTPTYFHLRTYHFLAVDRPISFTFNCLRRISNFDTRAFSSSLSLQPEFGQLFCRQ